MSAARFETTERAKPRLLTSIVEVSPEFRKALAALSKYQFRAILDTEAGLAVAALKSSYVTGG